MISLCPKTSQPLMTDGRYKSTIPIRVKDNRCDRKI
jgi:hypothetical protein